MDKMLEFTKKYTNKLWCFSPPVMLATFAVELGLLMYALWRYKLTKVTRLAVAMLGFLAVFQLAEYMVCGGAGLDARAWSRIGHVAITLLPALGIHFVYALAGASNKLVVGAGYTLAAAFAVYFLLSPGAIVGSQCMGNYVIFHVPETTVVLYSLYYYGLLLVGIGIAWWLARTARPQSAKALYAFIVGYLLFLLPTTTANIINPSTISGIPSIMCGFAVLLALVIGFWILPATVPIKQKTVARQSYRRKA